MIGYTVHNGTINFDFGEEDNNDKNKNDMELEFDYVLSHRFYVIVQKDETKLAIIERRNTIGEILPILKHLKSEMLNELIREGMTDEQICSGLNEEVTKTDMAYYFGKGSSEKGEFNIFIQSEWIKVYEE